MLEGNPCFITLYFKSSNDVKYKTKYKNVFGYNFIYAEKVEVEVDLFNGGGAYGVKALKYQKSKERRLTFWLLLSR